MKVAVIGMGQLGTALMEVLGDRGIAIYHDVRKSPNYCDVCHRNSVLSILKAGEPDWVINTAAFHQVDMCESEPQLAFNVNAVGAYNVASVAKELGIGVVYISTDYVFGHDGPFSENDVCHPLNVYGASKVAGENLTMAYASKWLVVRTSTLFGGEPSKGLSFVDIMLKLGRERDCLDVVSDIEMQPTYVKDLAQKIVEILENGHENSIVHITHAGHCTHKRLAEMVFRDVRLDVEVRACLSVDRDIAVRPRCALLKHNTLKKWGMDDMRPWYNALYEYLKEKINEDSPR